VGAVLLRKAVLRETAVAGSEHEVSLWEQMDGPSQEGCRGMLLQLFQTHPNADVQHRLGDALAEVARLQAQYGEWPELVTLLLQGCTGAGVGESLVLSLLRVLGAVPEIVENRLLDSGSTAGEVVRVLQACLQHSSVAVRLEALRAIASLVYILGSDDDDSGSSKKMEAAFAGTIAHAAGIVGSLAGNAELQAEALLTLIDLVQTAPRLFRTAWSGLAAMLLELVGDASGDEDVRKGGLELLMTLIESIKKARKEASLVGAVLNMLLSLVASVEQDESDWLQRTPDEDDLCEGELLSQLAEQALDRLAMDLGGRALMPHLQQMLPASASSADWRMRYAGLRCLASVTEGCMDVLADGPMQATLGLIWPAFDPSNRPRVQHAACHALGQLCTDFDGAIQAQAGEQALGALVGLLAASKHARVQSHAAAALINFAEGVEPARLAPHLDSLVTRLVVLLQVEGASSPSYLRAQLLATLGAFASAAGLGFARYYGAIVPPLLQQVMSAGAVCEDREERQLHCRALEALFLSMMKIVYALGQAERVFKDERVTEIVDVLAHFSLEHLSQQVNLSLRVNVCIYFYTLKLGVDRHGATCG